MSTWKDRLRSAPQQPTPSPATLAPPVMPVSIADRKAAEAKWAADAEILERYADSPLYARTALNQDVDPLANYVRQIEPFTMERWAELDGPTFREQVKA